MKKTLFAALFLLGAFPTLAQPRGLPISSTVLRADDCTAIVVPSGVDELICIDNDDAKVYRCTSTGTCVEAVPTSSNNLDFDGDGTDDLTRTTGTNAPNVVYMPEINTLASPNSGGNIIFPGGYAAEPNSMTGSTSWRSIFGGIDNTIGDNISSGTFGCMHCTISGASSHANIFGGASHNITDGEHPVILGGFRNDINSDGDYSAIIGGFENESEAPYAYTMGRQAKAVNRGSINLASDSLGAVGDAQATIQVLQREITGTSYDVLVPLSGVTQVPEEYVYSVWGTCAARDTASNDSAHYELRAAFANEAGTIRELSSEVTVIAEDDSDWDMYILGDSALNGFKIRARADTGVTARFICTLTMSALGSDT